MISLFQISLWTLKLNLFLILNQIPSPILPLELLMLCLPTITNVHRPCARAHVQKEWIATSVSVAYKKQNVCLRFKAKGLLSDKHISSPLAKKRKTGWRVRFFFLHKGGQELLWKPDQFFLIYKWNLQWRSWSRNKVSWHLFTLEKLYKEQLINDSHFLR